MKSIALRAAFSLACIVVASFAHAANLHITPPQPVEGQPFTIDFDYVTTCLGPLDPKYPPSAQLEPADGSVDVVRVGVGTSIQCFDTSPSHGVHVSAPMTGLAAGTYPIYSQVGILNGFLPYLDVLQQGSVTVGGGVAASPLPTLSFWSLILLVLAIGLVAAKAGTLRDPTQE